MAQNTETHEHLDLWSVERVFCKNKAEGCTEHLRLGDWKAHCLVCPFESLVCEYSSGGCKQIVQRGGLKDHEETCPFRPVNCPMCQKEVTFDTLRSHDEEICCAEQVVGCPYGCPDNTLKRKETEAHREHCPVHPTDCKFKRVGCKFVDSREEVEKHEKEDLSYHLELVTGHVADMQLESANVQIRLRNVEAVRDELMRSGGAQQEEIINDMKLKFVVAMEKCISVERKVSNLQHPTTEALEQRVTQLEQAQDQQSSEGGGPLVSTQLTDHDHQLEVHGTRMAEMDLRCQLLEATSYDGTLVWKIRDYDRRKRDALTGRTVSLFSQPFYSSRFGYKMCARVYLNGDGMGKATHMSLFFFIMRGQYDALLHWPFRQKVTLSLLDQSPEERHLTDHFHTDPNSSSFQRPSSDMNVASGCPLFVSHSVLDNPVNGYVMDNTVFIQIIVDPFSSTSAEGT